MTKFWRCYAEECGEDLHGRLGYDFEAPVPVCPKCGADGRKPEGKDVVIRREVLHLMLKDPKGPIVTSKGRRRIACGGSNPKGYLGEQRCTAQASVVSCPKCKATPEYAESAHDDPDVVAEKDFEVEVDHGRQELRAAAQSD